MTADDQDEEMPVVDDDEWGGDDVDPDKAQDEYAAANGQGELERNLLDDAAAEAAQASLSRSLITLGFVAFDGQGTDNTSSSVMVSEELRRHFRRDAYVGIEDREQGITFLGRVVEGPFHIRRAGGRGYDGGGGRL